MPELDELFAYMLECSRTGLMNMQLRKLGEAANLAKEMREVIDEMVLAQAAALVARLLLDHGEELVAGTAHHLLKVVPATPTAGGPDSRQLAIRFPHEATDPKTIRYIDGEAAFHVRDGGRRHAAKGG